MRRAAALLLARRPPEESDDGEPCLSSVVPALAGWSLHRPTADHFQQVRSRGLLAFAGPWVCGAPPSRGDDRPRPARPAVSGAVDLVPHAAGRGQPEPAS